MTHYQDDKYENFMANLRASRPVLAAFADFTVMAVGAPGVDGAIGAQLPGLVKARADFRDGLVARTAGSGSSQTGTSTEQIAFDAFKAFITDANTRYLQPYFLDHPDAEATFYPGKLSGLTQAPKAKRLDRLTAYTEALEAAPTAPADKPNAPGFLPAALAPQARALLKAYTTAASTKTKSRTTLADTLAAQGTDFDELAEALWDVHTAALFVHRRTPRQARKYFDYASLPSGASPTAGADTKP
jgi:hypothetical protein